MKAVLKNGKQPVYRWNSYEAIRKGLAMIKHRNKHHQPRFNHDQSVNRHNGNGAGHHERIDPSHEEVQLRAYQLHEEKGGSDFENWLEAERLLREEYLHFSKGLS